MMSTVHAPGSFVNTLTVCRPAGAGSDRTVVLSLLVLVLLSARMIRGLGIA